MLPDALYCMPYHRIWAFLHHLHPRVRD
jgi:hypothetical protein